MGIVRELQEDEEREKVLMWVGVTISVVTKRSRHIMSITNLKSWSITYKIPVEHTLVANIEYEAPGSPETLRERR